MTKNYSIQIPEVRKKKEQVTEIHKNMKLKIINITFE